MNLHASLRSKFTRFTVHRIDKMKMKDKTVSDLSQTSSDSSEIKREQLLESMTETLEKMTFQLEALIVVTKSQQAELNELNQRMQPPTDNQTENWRGYL